MPVSRPIRGHHSMKRLSPDDNHFIPQHEEKSDENHGIISENISVISQDNELLGETLTRVMLHIEAQARTSHTK